jgi:hypothetical protein
MKKIQQIPKSEDELKELKAKIKETKDELKKAKEGNQPTDLLLTSLNTYTPCRTFKKEERVIQKG